MPTPFMHLQLAERLKRNPALSPGLRVVIESAWSSFYFGNVVPDFQSITDLQRGDTHFYPIPPLIGDYDAFARMLKRHPEMIGDDLVVERAIFIAAYGVHLHYDLLWHHNILTPVFLEGDWGDRFVRFNAHNALLTALDRQALAELPHNAGDILLTVNSEGWLPFGRDEDIARWQKILVEQLQPGASIRTVELYAKRLGLSPEAFAGQLDDPNWMESHIFQYISQAAIADLLDRAVAEGIPVVERYLNEVRVIGL